MSELLIKFKMALPKQQGIHVLVIETCVVDSINSWVVDSGTTDHVCNPL